jgi:hypothetical protein
MVSTKTVITTLSGRQNLSTIYRKLSPMALKTVKILPDSENLLIFYHYLKTLQKSTTHPQIRHANCFAENNHNFYSAQKNGQ